MIEVITNVVVLLACIMCIITLIHQLKPKLKRKPKRLFYVKSHSKHTPWNTYLMETHGNKLAWAFVKSNASKLTDAEYDRIKHLLPNDHTLELTNHG